jgi:hypothetical protein
MYNNDPALAVCTQCGKAMDEAASPATLSTPPKTKHPPVWVIVVLCVASGLFWAWLVLRPTTSPTPIAPSIGDPAGAYVSCKDWIESNLKSPAGAQWQSSPETAISHVGADWRVVGYVDAPNSFNALIRTTYDCTVTITGKNWKGKHLTLGDKVLMP